MPAVLTEPTRPGPAAAVGADVAAAAVVLEALLSPPQAVAGAGVEARARTIAPTERVDMERDLLGAGAGHRVDCQGASAAQRSSAGELRAARRCQGPPKRHRSIYRLALPRND